MIQHDKTPSAPLPASRGESRREETRDLAAHPPSRGGLGRGAARRLLPAPAAIPAPTAAVRLAGAALLRVPVPIPEPRARHREQTEQGRAKNLGNFM